MKYCSYVIGCDLERGGFWRTKTIITKCDLVVILWISMVKYGDSLVKYGDS